MSQETPEAQTLVEHLTELRKRLFYSLLFVLAGFIVCWNFSDILFDLIRAPIEPYLGTANKGLVFTAPMDKFLAHIKVSFLGGMIATAPLWLHQAWLFVSPGLYQNERRYALGFIFSGSLLFFAGVSFVYFVVYPACFNFLMGFGGTIDSPMITIGEYLSFFTTTTLMFGLAFEMPLILVILGMMGVINAEMLISKRRYAIVGLAALSAVLTPPDVLSMLFMLVPMVLLYEASIYLVRLFAKQKE